MIKDKIFFTTAIEKQISLFAWLVKLFNINQTKPKQSFSSGPVVPTGSWRESYSTSGRIKPSCYSLLLFHRLFHIAVNVNVETQRMGNGNKVLHTIPQQPQFLSLVRFRCFNVKMTREFGWCGITRWRESYSTSTQLSCYQPNFLVINPTLLLSTNLSCYLWSLS